MMDEWHVEYTFFLLGQVRSELTRDQQPWRSECRYFNVFEQTQMLSSMYVLHFNSGGKL